MTPRLEGIIRAALQRAREMLQRELPPALLEVWPVEPAVAVADAGGRVLGCTSVAGLGPLGEAARGIASQSRFPVDDGDTVLVNDPFSGGTRVQDFYAVRRIDAAGGCWLAVATATVPDFGGDVFGGYNPAAVEVWAEGNRLTPLRIARHGLPLRDAFTCTVLNSRTPKLLERELRALLAGVEEAAAALAGAEWPDDPVVEAAALRAEAADGVRRTLAPLRKRLATPRSATVPLDSDGLHVALGAGVADGRVVLDFGGSSPQAQRYVNATRGVTLSAALSALLERGEQRPPSDGLLDAVEVRTRTGTVVEAAYPAPTACGPHVTAAAVHRAVRAAAGFPAKAAPVVPRLLDSDGFLAAAVAERVQVAEAAL